jgi:cytosine/adenosine deaminase-related metal-dependent hydrolase
VVFHEPIGFRAEGADALLQETEDWLDAASALIADTDRAGVTLGLAPHAPYSVSPALIQELAAMARLRGLPFSIHLSETAAELEFVRSGTGQLRELLVERGAWDPAWTPPGASPVRYLADLGVLSAGAAGARGLAVHCNYLEDEDIQILKRGRLVPTWCPGSHQFFGHRRHPAPELLDAGVPVALGTDSPASNAGLNMLREVRLAGQAYPKVDRDVWVRAATLTAAEGLGLGALTGSLEVGKAADLQILEGVPEENTDPLTALYEANLRVRAVLIEGVEMKIR